MKLKCVGLLLMMAVSPVLFALMRETYTCWDTVTQVYVTEPNGTVTIFETVTRECGFVYVSDGDGSDDPPEGPGEGTVDDCDSGKLLKFAKKVSIPEGSAVTVVTDMDGNGFIEAYEEVCITDMGLSLEDYFSLLEKTHYKAIQFGMGKKKPILVVDLDGDGMIENPRELFYNLFTAENLPAPNAAVALRQFDLPQFGGNGDGMISDLDWIWDTLYLWQDKNRDGDFQSSELDSPSSFGIEGISPFPEPKWANHKPKWYELRVNSMHPGAPKKAFLY